MYVYKAVTLHLNWYGTQIQYGGNYCSFLVMLPRRVDTIKFCQDDIVNSLITKMSSKQITCLSDYPVFVVFHITFKNFCL